MAGAFIKNNGYVYNGEDVAVAAQDLGSGLFVEIASGEVKLATAATAAGYLFKVVETTEYNGEPAVRVDVLTTGAEEVFMTEIAGTTSDGLSPYGEIVAKKGQYVRKRRPTIGDQILVTIGSGVSVQVGDKMDVADGTGKLVKVVAESGGGGTEDPPEGGGGTEDPPSDGGETNP